MSNHSHYYHHSSESKGLKFGRMFLAFFLFLCIATFSIAISAKIVILNSNRIDNIFTNEIYVQELYDDVSQYAHDACLMSGIDEKTVDSAVNYETIYALQESYTASALNTDSNYNDSAFDADLEEFNENLVSSVTENLTNSNYKIDKTLDEGINQFSQKITDYIKKQITFEYMSKLQTIGNLGENASLIVAIVFVVLSIVLALIILSMGTKKYRTLRAINYSFYSAGLFNLVLVAGMEIVKYKKTLVIYPEYLCDSVMKYINECIMTIGLSGVVLLVASIVITTVVWQLKHADK